MENEDREFWKTLEGWKVVGFNGNMDGRGKLEES